MENFLCISWTRLTLFAVLAASPAVLLADATQGTHQDKLDVAVMTDDEKPMQSQKMQEKMLRMHEMMHKIMQSKDGVERERLIQEHRKMLEENMHMMHSMGHSKCGSMQGGHKDM